MNKLRALANGENLNTSCLKTAAIFSLSVALGAGFWMASAPMARAASTSTLMTPAEMIQSNLPRSMSLANASKARVLSAVCKAVGKYEKDTPQIVRTAAGARKDLTSDIVSTAVRCLRGDGKDGAIDCGLVRSALNEAIAVNGEQAASLTELVATLAPSCLDSPGEGPGEGAFTNPPGNINPAPGLTGGGGRSQDTCTVCHNNSEIQVACSELASYLRGHPGDTAGACQASVNVNR
jgi:hypothetical protein